MAGAAGDLALGLEARRGPARLPATTGDGRLEGSDWRGRGVAKRRRLDGSCPSSRAEQTYVSHRPASTKSRLGRLQVIDEKQDLGPCRLIDDKQTWGPRDKQTWATEKSRHSHAPPHRPTARDGRHGGADATRLVPIDAPAPHARRPAPLAAGAGVGELGLARVPVQREHAQPGGGAQGPGAQQRDVDGEQRRAGGPAERYGRGRGPDRVCARVQPAGAKGAAPCNAWQANC